MKSQKGYIPRLLHALKHNLPVLVVGTTPDYIGLLRKTSPGRACYVTDRATRRNAAGIAPSDREEVLCDLANLDEVRHAVRQHLMKWNVGIGGIACFDCESMVLAAELAAEYSVAYPSVEAVWNCRNKYTSKVLWKQTGIACPEATLVQSPDDARKFFLRVGGPCVIKPLIGSGSELVFRCDDAEEYERAGRAVFRGLGDRQNSRLFKGTASRITQAVAEEFVNGIEYSCDFVMDGEHAKIIRLTRKLTSQNGHFGTIRGYVLEDSLPENVGKTSLEDILWEAARCLGLRRALCMVDFKVNRNEVVLLEMTPRPGGDCIPFLLKHARGLDVIRLALDFAAGSYTTVDYTHDGMTYVGLRLHAERSGILRWLDARRLAADSRVLEVSTPREAGHVIHMPPTDYDSWFLGHVVFRANNVSDINTQCDELTGLLDVVIE